MSETRNTLWPHQSTWCAELPGQACANCKFWRPTPGQAFLQWSDDPKENWAYIIFESDESGSCHRYPPTYANPNEYGAPLTAPGYWCGEWEQRCSELIELAKPIAQKR